jgi:Ca2+-binding RTX toxin-like protein
MADSRLQLDGPTPQQLISPDFASFSSSHVLADRVLQVHLHSAGGAITVGGGPFGAQTIQSLPMDLALQTDLQTILARLDRLIGIDFSLSADPNAAEVSLYLDQEIDTGDSGNTLGLALINHQQSRQWWEVIINGPALAGRPDYERYAFVHELGHVLGLEHPFDNSDGDSYGGTNPYASAFPEDTVMAYRTPRGGAWPQWFSDNDIEALVTLWGAEQQLFSEAADMIIGQNYSENLAGAGGADTIIGGGGNDTLSGGRGRDQLFGGPGADRLFAGAGNDVLRGGRGDDQLTGGRGADWFYVSAGFDQVMDFRAAEGDRLALAAGLSYGLVEQANQLLLQTALGTTALAGVNLATFDPGSQIVIV